MIRPTQRFHEHSNLLRWLRSLDLPAGARLLEVGCGYGDKMRLMAAEGVEVVGVDVNEKIVQANREAGLTCMTPDEFDRTTGEFDVLLLAHIIEHFLPEGLRELMDHYLDRVKVGGHAIVATPTLWPGFHDEFDHVRPYPPQALLELFGEQRRSFQFVARNRLSLVGVRLRRRPLGGRSRRPLTAAPSPDMWRKLGRKLHSVLFKASFGLLGQTTGWCGLFRKLEPRSAQTSQQGGSACVAC